MWPSRGALAVRWLHRYWHSDRKLCETLRRIALWKLACLSLILQLDAFFPLNTAGNLMPPSPRSIRKISDDHKAFALGRQTQARIQAYELPTFRPMLADKQRCCQLQ